MIDQLKLGYVHYSHRNQAYERNLVLELHWVCNISGRCILYTYLGRPKEVFLYQKGVTVEIARLISQTTPS